MIWRRSGGLLSQGYNHPVDSPCDGSDACRADCAKRCLHAEQHAIMEAQRYGKGIQGAEMLHVKIVDDQPVPSGEPSCWQCSRVIIGSDLAAMWLLVLNDEGEPVLRRYTTREFHELTLRNCGIHPYRPPDVQAGDFVLPGEDPWDRFLDLCADHLSKPLPLYLRANGPPVLEIESIDPEGRYKLAGLPVDWWWEPGDVEVQR